MGRTASVAPQSWLHFPKELGELIGKMGFSQTNLFGEFSRTQHRPLYRKFYARNYKPKLPTDEALIFAWRMEILSSLKPRIPRCHLSKPDFIVYTDAAPLSRKIAGLIITPIIEGPAAKLLAEAIAPIFRLNKLHRKNPIIWMEMLAPLSLLYTDATLFTGQMVNFYIDNDTAASTLIRGDCADPVLAAMIKAFWKQAEHLSMGAWVGRVGSKVNPAGLPARHEKLHSPVLRRVQFNALFKLMCTTILNKRCAPQS